MTEDDLEKKVGMAMNIAQVAEAGSKKVEEDVIEPSTDFLEVPTVSKTNSQQPTMGKVISKYDPKVSRSQSQKVVEVKGSGEKQELIEIKEAEEEHDDDSSVDTNELMESRRARTLSLIHI